VAITAAIHRFLGATPSSLALVQADDLAQETVAINVPGTDRERPNWRRRIGIPAGELWDTPLGEACRSDFAARRDPDAATRDPLAGAPGDAASTDGGVTAK
jgi:glycogen operon protein